MSDSDNAKSTIARVTCLHTCAAEFHTHFPVHCHGSGLHVNEIQEYLIISSALKLNNPKPRNFITMESLKTIFLSQLEPP
jgi:hypothetical protein